MRLRSLTAFLLVSALSPVSSVVAQIEPPSTGGATALRQELRMLGHYERVLVIGAHPDDEDTELLTVLVRGMGAEAAYLALNRGEGGQNLIGSELGETLGLLRTEELLAARKLDGAQQFFTRAYDFGFSKTLDDTWAHWPRDSILKDVVRIVRRFRPQIIVSIFSGTPRDGHGQHQAAGWAAQEAYRIAGDPARFPELQTEEGLTAWTPQRLYRSTWFDTAATTLTLAGGTIDPAVGKSYHQIAMQGRSRHRSQDMGRLQQIGASPVRLALLKDGAGAADGGLFSGIDTTLAAMAAAGGDSTHAAAWLSLGRELQGADSLTASGLASLRARVVALAGGETRLSPEQRQQLAHLDAAIANLSGILCDAVVSDERVVPGQRVRIATTCVGMPAAAAQLEFRGHRLQTADNAIVTVPDSASLTRPYFLEEPKQGDLYSWRTVPPALRGTAREPPTFAITYGGVTREAAFRFNDQSIGEQRRPVAIVPRLDVKIDPDTALWPVGAGAARRFRVVVTHFAPDTTAGRVRLELPRGWTAVPPQSFTLDRPEQSAAFDFDVRAPASLTPGRYEVRAVVDDAGGRRYDTGVFVVDYPHIRARTYTVPSAAQIQVAPLALPRLAHVGYVRGAADRIPEALAGAGLSVELLDAATLARGNLARYEAIVIGPRAYETDSALIAHNDRLLAYARDGGLLLVQYQQYQFIQGGFAPFPLTIASPHDRVTDENAAVRLLAPDDPAFQRPNVIGERDWQGWIQERGLYFAHTWDGAYRPLLESHDPGEGEQKGGLLVARLGRGTYVYTGLAFFRELPAGVPGAYRLFANLLGLAQAPHP